MTAPPISPLAQYAPHDGNPFALPVDVTRCRAEVHNRQQPERSYQCLRHPLTGGIWCNIHKAMLARRKRC